MNHTSIAFALHDRRSNRILKAKKQKPRSGDDDSAPISDAAVRDEAQGKKLSAKHKKKLLKEVQSLRSCLIFEQHFNLGSVISCVSLKPKLMLGSTQIQLLIVCFDTYYDGLSLCL